MPSEPAARNTVSASRRGIISAASSWQRPPRPLPVTSTVVSPPETSARGRPPRASARRASQRSSSRGRASALSPVVGCSCRCTAKPAACSASRRAWSRWRLVPMSPFTGGTDGVLGGASPRSSTPRIAAGTWAQMPLPSSSATTAAKSTGSGTVGPEPMEDRLSPGTSERYSPTTRAGAASAASPPPLKRETALRTVLISWMSMLVRSIRSTSACFSARVMPASGAGSRAEAPPETSTSTTSAAPTPPSRASTASAAATPRSSGTGWPVSWVGQGRPGRAKPSLVTTSPPAMRSPSRRCASAAMGAAALPMLSSHNRPAGASATRSLRSRKVSASPPSRANACRSRYSGVMRDRPCRYRATACSRRAWLMAL